MKDNDSKLLEEAYCNIYEKIPQDHINIDLNDESPETDSYFSILQEILTNVLKLGKPKTIVISASVRMQILVYVTSRRISFQ